MRLGDVEAAGRELRRLHIEITDLRAQLESIGAGGVSGRLVQAISAEPAAHVQNPAENEHVADDVAKNGAESNMTQQPVPADSVLEDAARWQMVVLVGNEVMLHPEKRSYAAAVAAYMDAVHRGLDLTGAIDSARKQGGA